MLLNIYARNIILNKQPQNLRIILQFKTMNFSYISMCNLSY